MLYTICVACGTEEEKVWVPNENPPREAIRGEREYQGQGEDFLKYRLAVASLHSAHCLLFADCREELRQIEETLSQERIEN